MIIKELGTMSGRAIKNYSTYERFRSNKFF